MAWLLSSFVAWWRNLLLLLLFLLSHSVLISLILLSLGQISIRFISHAWASSESINATLWQIRRACCWTFIECGPRKLRRLLIILLSHVPQIVWISIMVISIAVLLNQFLLLLHEQCLGWIVVIIVVWHSILSLVNAVFSNVLLLAIVIWNSVFTFALLNSCISWFLLSRLFIFIDVLGLRVVFTHGSWVTWCSFLSYSILITSLLFPYNLCNSLLGISYIFILQKLIFSH